MVYLFLVISFVFLGASLTFLIFGIKLVLDSKENIRIAKEILEAAIVKKEEILKLVKK